MGGASLRLVRKVIRGLLDKSSEMVYPSLCVGGNKAGGLHQVSCSLTELPGQGGHGPHRPPELRLAEVSGDSSPCAQGLLLCETHAARGGELSAKLKSDENGIFLSLATSLVWSVAQRFCG